MPSYPTAWPGFSLNNFFLTPQQFGAAGDGITDDTTSIQACADACFGPASSPHGATPSLNVPMYFPPGKYLISGTTGITLRSVLGGIISGAGRFASQIINNTVNGPIFTTNGFAYTIAENMLLQPGAGAVGFDLTWDNTGGVSCQSNTFRNIYFLEGAYGLRIGNNGFMGSENKIDNCFFDSATVAGLATMNYNALQQTVIGGNCQSCAVGILVNEGSVNFISGMGFQLSSDYDIKQVNSANDTLCVIGCRSESLNFIQAGGQAHAVISGISHLNVSAGILSYCGGSPVTIERCVSLAGVVSISQAPRVKVAGSSFGASAWLTNPGITSGAVEIEDVMYGGVPNGTPGTIIQRQRISSAGTQNYTVA